MQKPVGLESEPWLFGPDFADEKKKEAWLLALGFFLIVSVFAQRGEKVRDGWDVRHCDLGEHSTQGLPLSHPDRPPNDPPER